MSTTLETMLMRFTTSLGLTSLPENVRLVANTGIVVEPSIDSTDSSELDDAAGTKKAVPIPTRSFSELKNGLTTSSNPWTQFFVGTDIGEKLDFFARVIEHLELTSVHCTVFGSLACAIALMDPYLFGKVDDIDIKGDCAVICTVRSFLIAIDKRFTETIDNDYSQNGYSNVKVTTFIVEMELGDVKIQIVNDVNETLVPTNTSEVIQCTSSGINIDSRYGRFSYQGILSNLRDKKAHVLPFPENAMTRYYDSATGKYIAVPNPSDFLRYLERLEKAVLKGYTLLLPPNVNPNVKTYGRSSTTTPDGKLTSSIVMPFKDLHQFLENTLPDKRCPDDKCPICMEDKLADETLVLVLPCDHWYCLSCIKEMIVQDIDNGVIYIKCPTCTAPVR